jgi:ribosomal protein S18 acetylase RimI-like enzyme
MNVDVHELSPEDVGALHEFFADVPAEDRTFFKQDVTDPGVAEGWVRDQANQRCVRRLAVDDEGRIVAFAALLPGVEGSSHVAEMVLVVAGRARRQGLGRALARRMLIEAIEHGFKKLTVETAADNIAAVEMFQKIGFEPEALLRDHLYGRDGQLHDIIILAHSVEENWSSMLAGGLEEAVG